MSAVQSKIRVKSFLVCPSCDHDLRQVNDMRVGNKSRYPDVCKNCGAQWDFFVDVNGSLQVTPAAKPRVPCLILVKSAHPVNPIWLTLKTNVEQDVFDKEMAEAGSSHYHTYYTESTCPVNWIKGEVVGIVWDNDTDPHGVFEFVRLISIEDAKKLLETYLEANPEARSCNEDHMDFPDDWYQQYIFPETVAEFAKNDATKH